METETIKTKLSADLKIALKAKDAIAVKTIRTLMSAIDNAEAVAVETPNTMPMAGGIAGATHGLGSTDVPRKELTGRDIQNIIQREIDELVKTIYMIKDSGRPEIEEMNKQIRLLKNYLV